MEKLKLNGVYLISETRNRDDGNFFFPCKKEEYVYLYFLFYKNKEKNKIELYHGHVIGDFLYWMQSFAQWSPLGKKRNMITDYKIEYDTISYSENNHNNKITLKEDRLLFCSDYQKERNIGIETYHFYPFPPYFFFG
jgi:hypothetical protein